MRTKLLTCVSSMDNKGIQNLEHSLKLFNYDYTIMVNPNLEWSWGGWHDFYKWCKAEVNKEGGYTHFIYNDGYDTLALGGMEEIEAAYKLISPDLSDMVYSCEKCCFPITDYAPLFPKTESRWKYINGGQHIQPLDLFIKMYERADFTINAQHWAHKMYLFENQDNKIKLDTGCTIFQSVAFSTWDYGNGKIAGIEHNALDEFERIDNRIVNKILGTKAPLMHGNGKAEFQFVYDCLNL